MDQLEARRLSIDEEQKKREAQDDIMMNDPIAQDDPVAPEVPTSTDIPLDPDVPMSAASSNVTQDPNDEPCLRWGVDMDAYFYDPTEEEIQVNSIKMDRAFLQQIEELITKARETESKANRDATAWFKETGGRATLWPTELWKMTLNNPESSELGELWEISLHRLTQTLGLLLGIPNKELTEVLDGGVWSVIPLYGKLIEQLG